MEMKYNFASGFSERCRKNLKLIIRLKIDRELPFLHVSKYIHFGYGKKHHLVIDSDYIHYHIM